MTSFLTGGLAGIGSQGPSKDAAILRDIDSRKLSYANKDFVKNISWLNNSVDVLSQYTQKLQSGVDQANMNAIEQIQGIFADLFILFAGFEPTGIDVGDVKYIIQGIGAFFGINPDTPFPLNLLEAAEHMFSTYIVPLPQFTDVVFDAIIAWAEDFGLSQEFIDSLTELRDAIEGLGASFGDLFDALKELLGAFGFLNFTSTSGLGELWDTVMDLIGGIGDIQALKPVLQLLSTLGVPFIQALTAIINGGSTFLGFISGNQVRALGDNVVPKISSATTTWNVGGSSTSGWVYDGLTGATDGSAGSLTTLGTGVTKRVITQTTFKCTPSTKFMVNGKLKWAGIPTAATDFGITIVFFNGATEVSHTNVNIATGHGATGGFTAVTATEITVPQNVDGFKIGAYVGNGISSGQVWADEISAQTSGTINVSLIDGLLDLLGSIPLKAKNLVGTIAAELFGIVPTGSLSSEAPNRLANSIFTFDAIAPAGDWSVDMSTSRTADDNSGSAHVTADGHPHALRTGEDAADIMAVGVGQKVPINGYVSHAGALSTGPSVLLQIVPYIGDVAQTPITLDTYTPTTPDLPWPGRQMIGLYTVPAGVTGVQDRIYVTEQALQGEYHFDDFTTTQTTDYNVIPGLAPILQTFDGNWRNTWDTIASAARGFPIVGAELSDVAEAIENFNPLNILGAIGSINLGGDVQGIVNVLFGIFHGRPPTSNASLADLQNAASANQSLGNTPGSDEIRYSKETITIPVDASWTNWIDAVPCGRGQAGQNGVIGFFGDGGAAAAPNPTTWHKGTHYDGTLTAVQITINSDGSSVVSIPGHSITALAATGPQTLNLFDGWQGKSSGELVYNEYPYTCGGVQNTPGGDGLSPGGGGGGGRGIVIPHGGDGGSAAAWVRCRAADVASPSTGADTTAPTGGTGSVVSVTNSSITFKVTGAVDA